MPETPYVNVFRNGTWRDFFALMRTISVSRDFTAERPMNTRPRERELLADDQEEG
jgi:hypothetical protein